MIRYILSILSRRRRMALVESRAQGKRGNTTKATVERYRAVHSVLARGR